MKTPCRALIFTIAVLCAPVSTWADEYIGGIYKYDARVAFLKAGVLEPAMSKVKMIRFATEAAVTILRIDDAIQHNAANNPNGGH